MATVGGARSTAHNGRSVRSPAPARRNELLNETGCDIEEQLPEQIARNAGRLRDRTGRASEISAVDAIVIAMAEPDGIVLSTDPEDLGALAAHALGVAVERP